MVKKGQTVSWELNVLSAPNQMLHQKTSHHETVHSPHLTFALVMSHKNKRRGDGRELRSLRTVGGDKLSIFPPWTLLGDV